MFCKNCGTKMNDDALFCPACGAKTSLSDASSAQQAYQPSNSSYAQSGSFANSGTNTSSSVSTANIQDYIVKGCIAVAAIIFGILAIILLVRIFDTVEGVTSSFAHYDGLVSALGTVGFIACGVILAGIAALAALPLVRGLMERNGLVQGNVDRSFALGIVFLVLCVAVWICKIIFKSPAGGDISGVLYYIFSTFGVTATSCIVPTIVALVILYVIRTKFVVAR